MNFSFFERIKNSITRKRDMFDELLFEGRYPLVEHIRDGVVIATYNLKNGITNVGKNYILDVGFNSGTQVASGSWCIGLIDNTSFSALAAADTMSAHGGWIEFTGYSQSTRVAWGQGAASSQAITNGSPATFDITSGGTLKGILITSVGTKGGTTGTLWSTAPFTADVPVATSDQIKISYALGC